MGHSQAEKASNRERILDEAAARIRAGGLDSLSVAGLMAAVDLTHGGFYNHFESRAELLAEALRRALDSGAGRAMGTREDPDTRAFATFVRRYLGRSHRDHPESGCAVAALVCDVGRADDRLKSAMNDQVAAMIDLARRSLPDEDDAVLAVSALVGALALSRVVTDRARSDALLDVVRDRLGALIRAGGEVS